MILYPGIGIGDNSNFVSVLVKCLVSVKICKILLVFFLYQYGPQSKFWYLCQYESSDKYCQTPLQTCRPDQTLVGRSRSWLCFPLSQQQPQQEQEHPSPNVARRRQTSYDVARLLLMAPIDPWQNSTPVFGAVAFCTTNIEDFRTPLTSTSSTISSTYSSQKRSLRWTSSKRKIMELI